MSKLSGADHLKMVLRVEDLDEVLSEGSLQDPAKRAKRAAYKVGDQFRDDEKSHENRQTMINKPKDLAASYKARRAETRHTIGKGNKYAQKDGTALTRASANDALSDAKRAKRMAY